MRRQVRPFIVEVKHKRSGGARKERSIWGDLDLAAVAADATRDLEKNDTASRPFIDSDPLSIDVERSQYLQPEHHMADPRDDETAETLVEAPVGVETEPKSTRKGPARGKAKPKRAPEDKAAKASALQAAPARTGRKVHSRQERTQKLDQIETAVARGTSLKSAVRQAGISDQTYYQWKKAAGTSPAAPAAPAGDLKDLLALEQENNRLKQLLAERLRKENAELKKKLGL